jgi:hypothetical protein
MAKFCIIVPMKHGALFKEIFRRTRNYLKTKEILRREYGIEIRLEKK